MKNDLIRLEITHTFNLESNCQDIYLYNIQEIKLTRPRDNTLNI